jgi:hypothetical protein
MAGKVTKSTELRVMTQNELGAMAKLALPLKQNKINIECLCGYEMGDKAVFYLVTNDNSQAKTLLSNTGFSVTENPVVLWTIDNVPGEVYQATTALAEARVNISYSYSTSMPGSKTSTMVFATNDANKTHDVLNRL